MVPDLLLPRLAAHAKYLEPVFRLASGALFRGPTPLRILASSAGISSTQIPQLLVALGAAEASGIVVRASADSWSVSLPQARCGQLALMLRGINLYLGQVHRDVDTVAVVISRPAEPSRLIQALERTLEGTWALTNTAEMLVDMATRATARFSVMTPFVDDDGADRITALFEATRRGVERQLIVRNGLSPALAGHAPQLRAMDVHVYDFRIARDTGYETETFHAKVVRVDDSECYVGSSNMTRWSFQYSLELGFHVRGQAGRQVSRVLDAVLEVSTRVEMS